MSLLNQPLAMPSRVKGAIQLLVQERGQRVKRETAEWLLAPPSLKGEEGEQDSRAMVRRTLDECVRLRVFVEDGDFLLLNPALPANARLSDTVTDALPTTLLDLILDPSNTENENLAAALAWFLGQDALAAPNTWADFGNSLREQKADEILEFNDTRYDNFMYWARYLGLANLIALPGSGTTSERRLMPDPTSCVRRLLGDVFGGESRLTAADYLRRLSARCGLFEGGPVRRKMDLLTPARQPKHLSSTSTLALLRLEEEETLRLEMHSDADKVILVDGPARRDISEIVWLGGPRES